MKSRHGEEEEKAQRLGVEVYKNSDTRAGTVDKTEEIGKTAGTSPKQKRDEEAEEEEEVIRNTVKESTIPHPPRSKRVRMRRWIHPSSFYRPPSIGLPRVSQTSSEESAFVGRRQNRDGARERR